MAELRDRHAQELSALFHDFLRRNPTIVPKDADTWTPEQAEQWRRLAADENERFAKERAQLAKLLRADGVVSSTPDAANGKNKTSSQPTEGSQQKRQITREERIEIWKKLNALSKKHRPKLK
jgi:hypothetical protein